MGTTDGHIFGSHDEGEHWILLGLAGAATNAVVTAIIVDPRNSQVLYASMWTREREGEGGGVFRSADGGRSWQDTGLSGHAVRALAQAPSDPDILIAGSLDGVFRFRSQNQAWERISPAADPELRNFDSLLIDPLDPDVIYAGTFHLPWKTMDGGQHWVPIHRGMKDDSDVLSLVVDPGNPRRIFAAACSGIYRSEDAGSLWREVQGIPNSSRRTPVIRADPSNPANLYAGTTEGLWKSVDGGSNWRRVSPADWVVNSLAIEPALKSEDAAPSSGRPGRILVGTEEYGVLSSDDGGVHFTDSNAGFFHRRVVSLAVDAGNPAKIAAVFAGAQESVVISDDGGHTWSSLGSGLKATDVQHLFSAPDGFVAAFASGGLARLDKEKGIWTRWGTSVEDTAIRTSTWPAESSSRRNAFLAHVNDLSFDGAMWFAATNEGLFASRDAGSHWSLIPGAPIGIPVNSVHAQGGGQHLSIVVALAMLFSDDAGATWQWHDLPLESGGAVRLEFADELTALAVAHNGLYITRDSGNTWNRAAAGLPQGSLTDLLVRPHMWLVSLEGGGLYVSRDRGANWLRVENHASFESGIAGGRFHTLAAEPASGLVLAGSSEEGLYVWDPTPALPIAAGGGSGK
ncbi:MAG TPA: hypothetical protein VEX69_10220 [Candidatus Limnocylindria bacterium]|nr:hypothetical protein [Candidatus Limnocylindria bacterium]